MPRADSVKTKQKILQVAERLFSKQGFQGTSVAELAQEAGVNKALIYYYFKNKDDIIRSLFEQILTELAEHARQAPTAEAPAPTFREKMEAELKFMARRRKIIAVMLMEALKSTPTGNSLFECAGLVNARDQAGDQPAGADLQRRQAYEFFTGFIPVIAFVALQDKWSAYAGCDRDQAREYFLEAFEHTHAGPAAG